MSILAPIEDLFRGMIKGVYAKSARILSSIIEFFGKVTNATPTGTSGFTLYWFSDRRGAVSLVTHCIFDQPIRAEHENEPKFIILFVECTNPFFVICYGINASTFSCPHYWTLIGLLILKIKFVQSILFFDNSF